MTLTKYQDFVGLASADKHSSHSYNSIKEIINIFLEKRGVEQGKYEPIGIATDFYSGEYHYFIICLNPDDSDNKTLIKLHLDPQITRDEYAVLINNYSSLVVYNKTINPNLVEGFIEQFEKTD